LENASIGGALVEPKKLDEIYRIAKNESERDGREPHVVELLEHYVKHRPEHAKAWMMYGDALRVLGRKDESLFALMRAYELAQARAYLKSALSVRPAYKEAEDALSGLEGMSTTLQLRKEIDENTLH
jgi:tetratricopeptide (TPR) repeat protein